MTTGEYECESEFECKSKQFFLIRYNIPFWKILRYYPLEVKPTIATRNLGDILFYFRAQSENLFAWKNSAGPTTVNLHIFYSFPQI